MRTVQATSHEDEDGMETYTFPSAINPNQRHCVTRVDEGLWKIAPVDQPDRDLSADEAVALIQELSELVRIARGLKDGTLRVEVAAKS